MDYQHVAALEAIREHKLFPTNIDGENILDEEGWVWNTIKHKHFKISRVKEAQSFWLSEVREIGEKWKVGIMEARGDEYFF